MHKTNIETLRDEAQRQLQLLKDLLQKALQKGLINAPVKNKHDRGTFDTESLKKTVEVLDGESFKLKNLEMVLAVVGTMKAGKSTSINAIVGAEVLPNRNRPMTALPTLIRHTPGVLQPRLLFENVKPLNDLLKGLAQAYSNTPSEIQEELKRDADMAELLAQVQQQTPFASTHEGEQEIFLFLKGLNDLVRLCLTVEVSFPFEEYATVDTMPVIEVEFSHLKHIPATQGRLILLDTPGPNEAGQQHLRTMLEDQLEKASAVLAVLDYTQLKSDADEQVRKNLLNISNTAKGRIYALVNKFDQKDRNSDDADAVKQYVAQTLMKGKIAEDNVFPVSANQGYLASRARNEIERNGELKTDEAWVKDFAKEAFGKMWEKLINNSQMINESADELWQDSGFALPLEQVIIEAHQNAALEALRSATSKLNETAKNADDFFKINVGALKSDAEALQKNIDSLQQDIENINQVEAEIKNSLEDALEAMKKNISVKSKSVEDDINKKIDFYLKEGKNLEHKLSEQKQREQEVANEEIKKLNENKPLWHLGNAAKTLMPRAKKIDGSGAFEGLDVKEGIITFDEAEKANNFQEKIETSIRDFFQEAECNIQDTIGQEVSRFNQELERKRSDSLRRIQESAQKNIEQFDIKITPTQPKSISLDTSIAGILENAVQEKTKKVTRSRRQSGAWGWLCEKFGTDDWGWESYKTDQAYYQVDLNLIRASSLQGMENLFNSAQSALDKDVYPQLHGGVEAFFRQFREKIEYIRGDLMSGIQKHRLDEAQKRNILNDSTQMAYETSCLVKDCTALNNSAEILRQEEGTSVTRAEESA